MPKQSVSDRLKYFNHTNPFLWLQCAVAGGLFKLMIPSMPLWACLLIAVPPFVLMASVARAGRITRPHTYFTWRNPFLKVGLFFWLWLAAAAIFRIAA